MVRNRLENLWPTWHRGQLNTDLNPWRIFHDYWKMFAHQGCWIKTKAAEKL
jgi:hypothetical protein